jgi:hypothetical protein
MRWPEWTGFKRKTLWDWLQLLIVPIVLALIAIGFNLTETARDNQRQDQRAREDRQLAEQARDAATRRAFVTDMTQAVMTDLVALDRLADALAGYPAGRAELDRQWTLADQADERWVVSAFTIGARLGAYYPQSRAQAKWFALQARVEKWWFDEQEEYLKRGKAPIPQSRAAGFKQRESSIIQQTQNVASFVLHG